jgi:coenzyme F420-0:L-glutamate ligase / coenzyme F420-1:gamma-L-glutamate ligase
MKDDLHVFLRSRRTIRHFKSDLVPVEIIQRILETASYAPSAHNLQPWRFVVLTGKEGKMRMAEAVASKLRKDMKSDGIPEPDIQARVAKTIHRTGEAPVIIFLCRDKTKVKPQSDKVRELAEVLMGTQSVALAGLQLLLAAHAEGLGSNWICWPIFAPAETSLALGLDSNWEPQGMIFLGYPAETPQMPPRMNLGEAIRFI